MASVKRIVEQLDKYLLAVEKGLTGTLPSGANMESTRTQRPGSRAPHKQYAERFLTDKQNAKARMCLEPALRYLKDEKTDLWYALADETTSPGLKSRLETVKCQTKHPYPAPRKKDLPPSASEAQHRRADAEYTQAVREHERRKAEWKRLKEMAPGWLERRDRAATEVAEFVIRWFPLEAETLTVNLDPEDEPAKSVREASEQDRRRNTETSYRALAEEVRRRAGEGSGLTEAKEAVAKSNDKRLGTPCSYWRVHDAWLFGERERKGLAPRELPKGVWRRDEEVG